MKIFNKYIMGAVVASAAAFTFQSCGLDEYNPKAPTRSLPLLKAWRTS